MCSGWRMASRIPPVTLSSASLADLQRDIARPILRVSRKAECYTDKNKKKPVKRVVKREMLRPWLLLKIQTDH